MDQDYREVNLKSLFWITLSKWKIVLLFSVLFAVIVSIFFGVRDYKKMTDIDEKNKRQEEYSEKLDIYNREYEQLNTQIENIKKDLDRQDYLSEHALMLQVDPYNVYEFYGTYHIDSGYQISPTLTFQNPDKTAVLTSSYASALIRLDLEKVLNEDGTDYVLDNPVNGNSLKVLNVISDNTSGLLEINIQADNKDHLDSIIIAVNKCIQETGKTLTEVVGEHLIGIIEENQYTNVQLDYVSLKEAFNNNINTLNTSLEEKQTELDELAEPKLEVISKKSVLFNTIKWFFIGFVIAIVISFLVVIIRVIIQDNIIDINEISKRYHVNYLGSYHGNNQKVLNKLDRWSYNRLNINVMDSSLETDYIRAKANKFLHNSSSVLIGLTKSEIIERLASDLSQNESNMSFKPTGNIFTSPDAVRELSPESNVIILERWEKGTHSDLQKEIDMVSKIVDKENIGIVLVY